MSLVIHPTGEEGYIQSDRRTLRARLGAGNTGQLEVFLEYHDPLVDEEAALGWYSLADLQGLINTAIQHYQNGTTP